MTGLPTLEVGGEEICLVRKSSRTACLCDELATNSGNVLQHEYFRAYSYGSGIFSKHLGTRKHVRRSDLRQGIQDFAHNLTVSTVYHQFGHFGGPAVTAHLPHKKHY